MTASEPAGTSRDVRTLALYAAEVLAVAVVYVVTARASQTAALPPGNVTPVWIPSGLMLAWLCLRGRHLWPGVFVGAAVGNAWAWFDPSSLSAIVRTVTAASLNGLGDVLCVLVGVWAVLQGRDGKALRDPADMLRFCVFAVFAGPGLSAGFGVVGLVSTGLAQPEQAGQLLATWWIGDGVGVLVLAPIWIVMRHWRDEPASEAGAIEALVWAGLAVASVAPKGFSGADLTGDIGGLLTMATLLWAATRFPGRAAVGAATLLVAARVAAALVAGSPDASAEATLAATLQLQLFSSVLMASSLLVTSAVVSARVARGELENAFDERGQQLKLQSAAIRATAAAVFVTDREGNMEWVNEAFVALSGYGVDDLVGANPRRLGSGRHAPEFFARLWSTILAGEVWNGHTINRHPDGSVYTVDQTITPICDDQGEITHFVSVQLDVSELLLDRSRLLTLATHDLLTGLANRARVLLALERLLTEVRRTEDSFAVVFLDLDRFKPINDSLGHAVGDEVLTAVARRLEGVVREMDLVARLGGDEFVVVIPRSDAARASLAARRMIQAVSAPMRVFDLGGRPVAIEVTASAGVAVSVPGDASPGALLDRADRAMYSAKQDGPGSVHVAEHPGAAPRSAVGRTDVADPVAAFLGRLSTDVADVATGRIRSPRVSGPGHDGSGQGDCEE